MPELRAATARRREESVAELCRLYGGDVRGRWLRTRLKMFAWRLAVRGAEALKRAIDVLGAVLGLVLLAPLFAAVAAAIKATDGGPVLFWQARVGRHARTFRFPKFRSMAIDAEARRADLMADNRHGAAAVTFKMRRDPRVTAIGRIIRKLSIDELPQLWLVLTGEMSLVGPRPPLPSEVDRYRAADRRRLEVKPGLTCTWQVSGRADIPFEDQLRLDLEYIHSRSLLLDVRLLLRTVPAVLLGRGAY